MRAQASQSDFVLEADVGDHREMEARPPATSHPAGALSGMDPSLRGGPGRRSGHSRSRWLVFQLRASACRALDRDLAPTVNEEAAGDVLSRDLARPGQESTHVPWPCSAHAKHGAGVGRSCH